MQFQKDKSFVSGRLKSIRFAFLGMIKLLTTEHSIMIQCGVMVVMIVAGFWFHISRMEWMMQIFCFGLVLSIEGLNTAIEKTTDFIHPEFHDRIGFIKDISAGAVLFAALAAIAIGLLIYIPKFYSIYF